MIGRAKSFSLCAALLLGTGLSAQSTATLKQEIGKEQKEELLGWAKELFDTDLHVGFSFTTKAAVSSLAGCRPNGLADEKTLERLTAELRATPNDPLIHDQLGNYHKLHGDMARSQEHFKRALELLDPAGMPRGSVTYLALRGILRHQLGLDGSAEDLSEALRMDPTDSLAFMFYPLMLLREGKFDEVRERALPVLERPEDPYQGMAFYYLLATQMFEAVTKTLMPAMEDSARRAELRAMRYERLMDLEPLIKAAALHPKDKDMQRALRMARLVGMAMKLSTAETKKSHITMPWTAAERAELETSITVWKKELKDTHITNKYGVLKSLAFASFLRERNDAAVDYAEQAIAAFPNELVEEMFNAGEEHELVLFLHSTSGDTAAYRKALERTIAMRPLVKEDAQAHTQMAQYLLLHDDAAGAERWANSALKIDPSQVQAHALAIHALYMQGFRSLIPDRTARLEKLATSADEAAALWLQFAIYDVLAGNAQEALTRLRTAEEADSGTCELCARIIDAYIEVREP